MTNLPTDYQPQSPDNVAKRALALAAYCCRGYIDHGNGNADAESLRNRMVRWVERFNLIEHLGTFEWEAISSPLGTLPSRLASQMSWEAEGLAVLVWALGRGPLPSHDGQVDPYAVTDSIHFLSDDAYDIISQASPLKTEELRAYRELMYAIHCRVRDFLRNGGSQDFESWLESPWLDMLHLDSSRIIVDRDLAVKGTPITMSAIDQVRTCEWSVNAQHRASIWLVGEEQKHWKHLSTPKPSETTSGTNTNTQKNRLTNAKSRAGCHCWLAQQYCVGWDNRQRKAARTSTIEPL